MPYESSQLESQDDCVGAGTARTKNPEVGMQGPQDATQQQSLLDPREQRKQVRTHYYVKIAVSTFLCALLLIVGVPVFMESRVTGSLSYTALGIVLVGFGLVLAAAVITLLFNPPFNKDGSYKHPEAYK